MLGSQRPAGSAVEQLPCVLDERRRTVDSSTKTHSARPGVTEIDLTECRVETVLQRRLAATLGLDAFKGAFDMFAGAQVVGGKVGARAKVLADARSANRDPVTATALRVSYGEFREDRLATEVFEEEGLLTPELPAQPNLPVFGAHFLGTAQARELGLAGGLGARFPFSASRDRDFDAWHEWCPRKLGELGRRVSRNSSSDSTERGSCCS